MISAPKPFLRQHVKLRRLLPHKSMTIAIGTHFADGVILCADTKFVDANAGVTYGSKLQFRDLNIHQGNVFAIAHAADDTNAAAMLSTDILDAAVACEEQVQVESSIKQRMTKWQSDYGNSSVPLLQFIFACSLANKAYLYFCQPPNIVIPKLAGASTCAGSAGKIVETLLPFVLQRQPLEPMLGDVESTLLKLAYLMKRAKSEDLYAGGDTEAIVIKSNGQWTRVWEEEMKDAEDFSASLDSLFRYCCYGLFSMRSPEDQKTFLERFSELFRIHLKDAEDQWFFHSLEDL